MTKIEFDTSFRRLERLYVKDALELEENLRAEYFAAVRYFTAGHLEQAIDLIRDTHKMKSLPTPAEIREAIEEVLRQTPRATAEELAERCELCGGDGWTIDETGEPGQRETAGVARYCECAIGRKMKQNHIDRGMGKMGPVSFGRGRRRGGKTEHVRTVVNRGWRGYREPGDDDVAPF